MRNVVRPLLWYLAIVAVLCAGFILLMKSLGAQGYYLAQGYMMTPALAAVVVRLFFWKNRFKDAHLTIGRRSDYLRFWAISLGIVLLSLASYALLGAVRWDLTGGVFLGQLSEQMAAAGQDINDLPEGLTPQIMLWLYFAGGLTVFNFLPGLITGFGEEFGWRGLMFPLLYRIRPWMAFIIGGLIWYGWHMPLTLVFPQSQVLSTTETIANLTILAAGALCTFIFLAYIYVRSGSVFVVSFAHIALNNASRSFSYFAVVENQVLANLGLTITMAIAVSVLYWLGELEVFRSYLDSSPILPVSQVLRTAAQGGEPPNLHGISE